MKKQKTRKKFNLIRIIIPVVLVGLIIWGIFVVMGLLSKNSNSTANNSGNNVVEQEEDPIKSKDPSTTGNIDDEKDISGGSDKPNTPTTNPVTGLKNATVEITYANSENSQVGASGQVTNVTETSGTCTYVFTNASTGQTITENTSTVLNSSYTVCESISFDKSKFSAGNWSVVLKYKSSYSEGESTSATFKVN